MGPVDEDEISKGFLGYNCKLIYFKYFSYCLQIKYCSTSFHFRRIANNKFVLGLSNL